ncbi:NAD(P)-binding protein [Sarocladium strictum]
MVKIAVAGGSGELAREVLDVLAPSGEHDIIILTRSETLTESQNPHGLRCVQVDYSSLDSLTSALRGIHTVLSYLQLIHDPESKAQKLLIDAAVAAGVKRFAPSEYGPRFAGSSMPYNLGKISSRKYLEEINSKKKVLEYTLFECGFFMNYLATPHKTAKHLTPLNFFVDFDQCRAVVIEGHDPIATFTTVQDTVAVVAASIKHEGPWPTVGGIQGHRLTFSELIKIGESVRGSPFKIHTVKLEDLKSGKITAPWGLERTHPSVSEEDAARMLLQVLIGGLLSCHEGAWDLSDEWNQLLPEVNFTKIDKFVDGLWTK